MNRIGKTVFALDRMVRQMSDKDRQTTISLEDIELVEGKAYALCGPSGIGKTTALEMLSLCSKLDAYENVRFLAGNNYIDIDILLRGEQEKYLTEIRGRHIGYIVQTSRLFPFLNVIDNIRISQNISGQHDEAFINLLMKNLEIESLASAMPKDLSGGQRQRVCIARALAHKPGLILADEPTSAVDEELTGSIMKLLVSYAEHLHAAVLIITHDSTLVEKFNLSPLKIASQSKRKVVKTRITTSDFPSKSILQSMGESLP